MKLFQTKLKYLIWMSIGIIPLFALLGFLHEKFYDLFKITFPQSIAFIIPIILFFYIIITSIIAIYHKNKIGKHIALISVLIIFFSILIILTALLFRGASPIENEETRTCESNGGDCLLEQPLEGKWILNPALNYKCQQEYTIAHECWVELG